MGAGDLARAPSAGPGWASALSLSDRSPVPEYYDRGGYCSIRKTMRLDGSSAKKRAKSGVEDEQSASDFLRFWVLLFCLGTRLFSGSTNPS